MASSAKRKTRPARDTELGTILKARRAVDKLSQRGAAELVGVEHSTISELERGIRDAEWETLIKISEGLGIPLEDLIRASAKDAGIDVSLRSDHALALALTARAAAFPDLAKVLRRLEATDPKTYQSFLMMFDVFERQNAQDDVTPP